MAEAELACVIGEGIQIRGKVTGAGNVMVSGRLEGEIEIEDYVTVDKGGMLVADVASRGVSVHGEVHGDLNAQEAVAVHAGAKIVGNIRTADFELDHDAQFYGFLDMPVMLPEDLAVELGQHPSQQVRN